MTTSWAHFTDGRWLTSFATNAGGFMFALIALVAIPLLAYWATSGRRPAPHMMPLLAIVLVIALTVTLVDWTFRLLA